MPKDILESTPENTMPSLDELFAEGEALEQEENAKKVLEQKAYEAMLADLPDQRVAYVNQKSKYAEQAKHRAEITKSINQAAKVAEAEYKRQNPEAADLVVRTKSSATLIPKDKRIDLALFYRKVLEVIMFRSDDFVTQKAILAEVNKDFLHAPQNSNRWTALLPKWQLTNMVTFIDGNRPQWRVSLANCKTLADCRKAMLLAKEALSRITVAKVTIKVTPTKVIVNDIVYPISKRKTGNNEYPCIRVGDSNDRKWLRVDALTLLLEETKK